MIARSATLCKNVHSCDVSWLKSVAFFKKLLALNINTSVRFKYLLGLSQVVLGQVRE